MALTVNFNKGQFVKKEGTNAKVYYFETSADQVKLSGGSTVESKITALEGAIGGQTVTYVVNDISARDSLENIKVGDQVWVKDASSDPTVTSGAAKYIAESKLAEDPYTVTWAKTSEAESMDLVIKWDDITDKPGTKEDVTQAIADKHSHTNKMYLDKVGEDSSGNLTYNNNVVGIQVVETVNDGSADGFYFVTTALTE